MTRRQLSLLTTFVFAALAGPRGAMSAPPPIKPMIARADATRATTITTLQAGQTVSITASGTWRVDGGSLYGTFDANGTTTGKPTEPCALVPTAKMGALVGSLDGNTWFALGVGPTRVTGPGVLQLASNDCTGGPTWPLFSDNGGTLDIAVSAVVQVPANQITPVFAVSPGDWMVVSAQSTWSIDGRNLYGTFDASGTTSGKPTEPCALLPTVPMGTLLGSSDGTTWFPIGARRVVYWRSTPKKRGPEDAQVETWAPGASLRLAPNDCPGGPDLPFFKDNSGALTVTISPPR